MADLIVSNIDNEFVVDSRLIADRLGVTHEATMKTIEKYLGRLEAKSPVRFQIDVVKRPQGGTFELRYAFLNERQAGLLMTMSRNTEQVLDLKEALIDAFAAAKLELTRPKTALELAREQVKLLEAIQLKDEQIALLQQTTERQAEVIDELFDYSSILRIAKYNKCSEKAFSWHKLKAASKTLGLEVKKAPSSRFEFQNLYSHDAWRLAYPGYRLPDTTTLVINQ